MAIIYFFLHEEKNEKLSISGDEQKNTVGFSQNFRVYIYFAR